MPFGKISKYTSALKPTIKRCVFYIPNCSLRYQDVKRKFCEKVTFMYSGVTILEKELLN